MRWRQVVLGISLLLPAWAKGALYRRCFGWTVGHGVRVGLSWIDADHVIIEDGVTIGHLNIFRRIKRLELGAGCRVLNGNHFFGATYVEFPCHLRIGRGSQVMSRQFIDVGGRVTIGDGAVIAGRGTQVWSHSIKLEGTRHVLIPLHVDVGERVYIGAGCMLVGCKLPASAVVGAGSVVTKQFDAVDAPVLIAGNPAKVVKKYASSLSTRNPI